MRVVLCLVLAGLWFSDASAAELTVQVLGLRNAEGVVNVALYDGPDGFPDSDGIYQEATAVADAAGITVRFEAIKPGTYAVAIHHDEDNDGDFDMFLFLPAEGYGFSNDAPVGLGPPDFEEAAFQVTEPATSITLTARY